MPWFHRSSKPAPAQLPPQWAPATEVSHAHGLIDDAPEQEFRDGEQFCAMNPVEPPRLLPSWLVSNIREYRGKCWTLELPRVSRFMGTIRTESDNNGQASSGNPPGITTVKTEHGCGDTCLLSNIPIICGLYQVQSPLRGVYYEVKIHYMNGVVALGMPATSHFANMNL